MRSICLAVAIASVAATIPARADGPAKIPVQAEVCAGCHSPTGISEMEATPSIAGEPDAFLQWQLVYFRAGTRKSEAMGPIAQELTNDDVRALGAYFSALSPPKPAPQDDQPALTEKGAKLAAQFRCATCHGDKWAGSHAVARLADQREDYLLKALRDFKSGARQGSGPASMADVVYPLTDDDFVALAHFLARVP